MGVPSAAVDGYQRASGIDVLHYDLALDLPAKGQAITARATILYEAVLSGIDSLALDFGPMTVDSVQVDGATVPFRHAEGKLVVRFPPSPAEGRREATVWYRGEPEDGLVVSENRHGERVIFADNWATRARLWFPAVDHPSDKATVAFDVTAPSRMEIVANGTLQEVTDLGEGRTRTRWAESSEIPTYCMVIGAADFAIDTAGEVDGIEVSHWTFPADSAAGAAAFARSTEILWFYDSLFGPYPYEKLAHVQSSTRFGGMENASAIFYDQDTIGDALAASPGQAGDAQDGLTSLVAHETVHQWFGDAVTEKDWHHLWLSEGFATYFAAVFFEFNGGARGRGQAELTRQMREMMGPVFEYEAQAGEPIYAPASGSGDYTHLLNPNNYQKGAWVLHMLRRLVGDRAFFGGIRDYYASLRDGTAWTADFERVMEEASGEELGWFFAQWVGRAGHPALEVESASAGGRRTRVVVRQVQPGEPFRLFLDLALRWPGSERRERVELTAREAAFVFETPARLAEVAVDPDGWLLHELAATRPETGSESAPK
ncbi:M1 family metallopeptidase [soil metagenome]